MRLFLDECLSQRIAANLYAEGVHLVEHPRDFASPVARRGSPSMEQPSPVAGTPGDG